MTARVSVNPSLLRWAVERSLADQEGLRNRFPRLDQWESGEAQPTIKQLEDFAKATHTPVGFLFLAEPPQIEIPIPDFRTVNNERLNEPSPDLLDTIYLCQQRQEWYRDYARSTVQEVAGFVGSATIRSSVTTTAATMRSALNFDLESRRQASTWTDALRGFIDQADNLGVLVMVSGIVGSNTHRSLDPAEFRGFALTDDLAPLVFINGADTKSAQMFTLAHELAHLWLGQSALSDITPIVGASHNVEKWCNRVAAELLVPLADFKRQYDSDNQISDEMNRLARQFKVSTLVILRRMHDAGGLTRDEFGAAYHAELSRLRQIQRGAGGNFYLTAAARTGKRFARAVVTASLEGRASFAEAFRLLGCRKMQTFNELGQSLGVVV